MSWRDLYPFQSHYWESPYGKIHYLDEGPEEGEKEAAPVIVMVHGNPTWSFFYRNLVLNLKSFARCVVPDHLGCGLSDKPQNAPYTLSMHIQNLHGLLKDLKVEQAHLIVHDWGGPIGLGSFLLDHTTSFKSKGIPGLSSLTVMNTAAGFSPDVPKRILLCRTPLIGAWIVRGLNGFAWPATWMAVETKLSREIKAGYLAPYKSWRERIATHRFVKDIPRAPRGETYQILQEIQENIQRIQDIPSLIFWGMKDFCFHQGFYQQWCNLLPHAKRFPFKHAGHYLLEDAGDSILSILQKELRNESIHDRT